MLPSSLTTRDRRFLTELADALRLSISYDEFNEDDEAVIVLEFDETMLALSREEDSDDEAEKEGNMAIERVLAKYDRAPTAKAFDEDEDLETEHAKVLEEKMAQWKNDYYKVWLHDLARNISHS